MVLNFAFWPINCQAFTTPKRISTVVAMAWSATEGGQGNVLDERCWFDPLVVLCDGSHPHESCMTIAHTNVCLWVQHAKPLALLSSRVRVTIIAKQPVLRAVLRRSGSPSKTPDRWTYIFGTMPEGTAIVRRHVLERGKSSGPAEEERFY